VIDMTVQIPPGYRPSPAEEFMNPLQVEYFRQKLLTSRAALLRELGAIPVAEESVRDGDQADQASAEVDREFEVINRERTRMLLGRVDQALARIEAGTYGFCEQTGEPIGLKRLEAQPTATLSIEAQERQERSGG
jgi:DnaK suppressor protein